jgi:L-methionine (R)-S-oxide reductase
MTHLHEFDGETLIVTVIQTVAIIDIDCAELDGFNKEDQEALEELADLLARSCDFQ